MKFIDEAKIHLKAGDGGDGCVSFRREKYVPRGGPNGGDGGNGGSIIIRSDPGMSTLLDYRYKKHFHAKRGQHGKGKDMAGRAGEDVLIRVPVGTIIKDAGTGAVIKDLNVAGEEIVIARGGRGGRGNMNFTTSTRQAPRFAEDGEKGGEKEVTLELKLLADIGLIGLPNSGKSTLLARISNARPKIASYPFTTKSPVLGVVKFHDKTFVVADLPGLIEGAHDGVGMGLKFLRHVERTKAFLHLVDIFDSASPDPLESFHLISKELFSYKKEFSKYPMIVILTKLDIPEVRERLSDVEKAFKKLGHKTLAVSAATGEGIPELIELAYRMIK